MDYKKIDQHAVRISKNFKKCESELLEIIIKIDELKAYAKLGYPSLFKYVIARLELSEAQTYNFITVARKSREIPLIKEKIRKGELTVNKAKKVTSVITRANQDYWLMLAGTASQKKVEREVALAHPQKAISEKMTYVSTFENVVEKVRVIKNDPLVKMELGLSEKLMLKIRRAQDLISQKKRTSVNLEKTLEILVDEYIKKYDPLEKAKRQKIKGKLKSKIAQVSRTVQNSGEKKGIVGGTNRRRDNLALGSSKRKALPVPIKHQVYLENKAQCSAVDDKGQRCASRRFLEIHHIKPLSQGGGDELGNLTLLCSGHHKAIHS